VKTGDFINALVEDQGMRQPTIGLGLSMRMAAGLAVSLVIFFMSLGVRSDFGSAMFDPHVVFKFIFAASLFGSLWPLAVQAVRPERLIVPLLRWLVVPLLVLGGGVVCCVVSHVGVSVWMTPVTIIGNCLQALFYGNRYLYLRFFKKIFLPIVNILLRIKNKKKDGKL
jgi:hypothetical protein